jgi:hypothetical protein
MEQEADKGDTNVPTPNQVKEDIPRYVPPHRFIPYPQRLANTKLDKQYARFVELLKKIECQHFIYRCCHLNADLRKVFERYIFQ